MAVFDFLKAFDNPQRRHSALVHLSPVEYERRQHSARVFKPRPVHDNGVTPICRANCGLVANPTAAGIPASWRRASPLAHSFGKYSSRSTRARPRGLA